MDDDLRGAGAGVMLLLVIATSAFTGGPSIPWAIWWPIQLGHAHTVVQLLVGLAVQPSGLHYGGANLFKKGAVFFIGLIVGDF
jgi:hypothetical protein